MSTNKKTFGTRTQLSAIRTSLRGMVRANLNHFNSHSICFIGNKVLELVETPTIQPEVKSFASASFSYTFKVLQNNSSSVTICNNLFTDYMIPMPFETSLPARNCFQPLLGRTSAFALESCSQSFEFESICFNFSPAKELYVASYSNMVYSDINTNLKSVRNLVDVDISGKCDVQKHSLLLVSNEQSSLIIPVEVFPIVFRNIKWNFNPSFNCCEFDSIKQKSRVSLVKGKRHNIFEGRFRTFVSLNRLKSLRSYPISIYHKLRWQIKEFSRIIIAQMVKLISILNIGSKTFVSNVRDCFRILIHSFEKQYVHRNLNFDSCNRLHNLDKFQEIYKFYGQMSSGGWQFLPTLKSRVSLPYDL